MRELSLVIISSLLNPAAVVLIKPKNENLRLQFQDLYEELVRDEERNQLVCSDVIQAIRSARSPIVLTERNEHLDDLFQRLEPAVKHLIGHGVRCQNAITFTIL